VAAINGQTRHALMIVAFNNYGLDCSDIVIFERPFDEEDT
jgi:hypothetical protein